MLKELSTGDGQTVGDVTADPVVLRSGQRSTERQRQLVPDAITNGVTADDICKGIEYRSDIAKDDRSVGRGIPASAKPSSL